METTEFIQQAVTFAMTLALALGFLYFNKIMPKNTDRLLESTWVTATFVVAVIWFIVASMMLWNIQKAVF